MTRRLILLLAVGALVTLALIVGSPNAGVRASVSQQAAATSTPTATAPAATATATSTAPAATATATSTAPAATATATVATTPTVTVTPGGPTATATATTVLAAYPAPLTSFSASHTGSKLVFRWSLLTRQGVKGFNLYAGTHKLNKKLIKTHASPTYKKSVTFRKGTPALRMYLKNGQYFTVRS